MPWCDKRTGTILAPGAVQNWQSESNLEYEKEMKKIAKENGISHLKELDVYKRTGFVSSFCSIPLGFELNPGVIDRNLDAANDLSYYHLAKNNLQAVLDDQKGARCVHCMKCPIITSETVTCDDSTIICPLCNVDAVIPASWVCNKQHLKSFHSFGFPKTNIITMT